MPALLAFAAALAAAQPQAAAPAPPDPQPMDGAWRAASLDPEGPSGRAIAFVEPASIVRDGSDIRFRADVRLERASSGADSITTLVHGDCASRRYEMLDIASYRQRRLMSGYSALPMTEARPGSNMADVLDRVCAGTYLSEPVDREAYARAYFAAQ